jgi:RND family efflux transporter MFP subunit
MKRVVITAVIFLAIGLISGWLIFKSGGSSSNGSTERKISFYRDPMNPAITSPTPKKSSDGMDFVPVYEEAKGGEKKIAYYKDPMHPWFTSDKPGKTPDCGMDMVPVYEGEDATKGIKIDPVNVQNTGVKEELVQVRKLTKTVRTVGKIEYDETKVYSINTKIMGWVETLHVDYTGKYVAKGQPLLEIYSPELVSTQEEYLQAIRYKKRMQASALAEALKGADELIQSAKRRLLYWDITEKEIQELEARGYPKKTMTIYSQVSGIVVEKMVFKGMRVMAGMDLYQIADLSTVWVQAEVYQFELPWVKLGQPVELELSYLPGRTFNGTITYIYPFLGMESKTVKVRIEVKNTPSLDFKQGMFATAKIKSPVIVEAVAIPEQSVIHAGERNVAVIALGGGYFDPRDVKLGVLADGYIQVLDGIKAGEKIVVSSQFLIDSESNLKAAISQMSGHAGMDMSKPESMKQDAKPYGEATGHEGMDMSEPKKEDVKKDSKQKSQKAMEHEGMDMSTPKDKVKKESKPKVEKQSDDHSGMDMNMDKMDKKDAEKKSSGKDETDPSHDKMKQMGHEMKDSTKTKKDPK